MSARQSAPSCGRTTLKPASTGHRRPASQTGGFHQRPRQRAISGCRSRPDSSIPSMGLARYAVHHFRRRRPDGAVPGMDPTPHRAITRRCADFVAQVEAMRGTADPTGGCPVRLVTNWLSFHILDTDRSMARQLRAVAADATPARRLRRRGRYRQPGRPGQLIAAVPSACSGLVNRNVTRSCSASTPASAGVAERTAGPDRFANRDLLAAPAAASTGRPSRRGRPSWRWRRHEINNPLFVITANLGVLRNTPSACWPRRPGRPAADRRAGAPLEADPRGC